MFSELLLHCLLCNRLSRKLLRTYWWLVPRQVVKGADEPLLNLSATKAAEKIRNGELVKAHLLRIKELQKTINATTEVFEEEALKAAQEVDDYLASLDKDSEEFQKLADEKPFLGVPVSIKDSWKTHGGLVYKAENDPPADKNAVTVDLLKKSGAIPIAHTNVPPACFAWESDNAVSGRTSIVYDHRCTCGGSSGGEGALISGQGSIFGIGSDVGGSIRVPSAFNGVFGLKPTSGTIDGTGHFPALDDHTPEVVKRMCSFGPICRYAEDLAIAFSTLSVQKIPSDLYTKNPAKLYFATSFEGDSPSAVSDGQLKAHKKAVDHLSSLYGLEGSKLPFPPALNVLQYAGVSFVGPNGESFMSDLIFGPKGGNVQWEMVKALVGLSNNRMATLSCANVCSIPMSPQEHARIVKEQEQFVEKFWNEFATDGVLVFPTFRNTHYFHKESTTTMDDFAYTVIFNVLNAPVVVVPLGLDDDGYPTGVQLVGRPGQEWLLIKVANDLSAKFGGWKPAKA